MLKQEQARLTKLQVTLEEDRRALIEQAGRERIELQQLIVCFLFNLINYLCAFNLNLDASTFHFFRQTFSRNTGKHKPA